MNQYQLEAGERLARCVQILHDQGFRHVAGDYYAKLPERKGRAMKWARILAASIIYLERKPRGIGWS